jgi:membrane-associated phospholipid phosphatase
MELRYSEWIVIAYFVYLAGAAAGVPGVRSRSRLAVTAMFAAATVPLVALLSYAPGGSVIREWAPFGYLLFGYWLPGRLVTAPNEAFERSLQAFDGRLFCGRADQIGTMLPRAVAEFLEVAYLFCYPFLPLGFAWLLLANDADVDGFWTAVLLAGFFCYGTLPWLPTRPPRAIRGSTSRHSSVRSANRWVLDHASVQWNTFPSGHVATAFATALVVASEQPGAGAVFLVGAVAIAIGSVVGAYHYAADAFAGVTIALAAFLVSLHL